MRTKNIETTIKKKSADIRFTIRLALVTELNVFDVFLRVAHFATCMHRVEPGPSRYWLPCLTSWTTITASLMRRDRNVWVIVAYIEDVAEQGFTWPVASP